jgi:hypothetical protein
MISHKFRIELTRLMKTQNTENEPVREPLINRCLGDLTYEVETLKQKIELLGKRLESIRRTPDETNPIPESSEPSLPQLGETIRNETRQIRLVNSVLNDIIQSLEI